VNFVVQMIVLEINNKFVHLNVMQATLKPGLLSQATGKLKEVDKFLGSNQWFAGERVRPLHTSIIL